MQIQVYRLVVQIGFAKEQISRLQPIIVLTAHMHGLQQEEQQLHKTIQQGLTALAIVVLLLA